MSERMHVELVLAPSRPEGYGSRAPVSAEWADRDWLCKYCDRTRSKDEPIWTWMPLGRGCTVCAFRLEAIAIDWHRKDEEWGLDSAQEALERGPR